MIKEIKHNGGVIYQLQDDFFCIIKDKIGFSDCYINLDEAKKEYDLMINLKEKNRIFYIKQNKKIEDERIEKEKREAKAKERKQAENESHVIKALEKIMNQEKNIITQLYYKDDNGNKTISINFLNGKKFLMKVSRKKEKILFYSEAKRFLLNIRNTHPCGRWH